MNQVRPILSICISTYNAAHLLRVTLGAVMPQAAELAGRVEVLVVDDQSKDETSEVVADFSPQGPLRYIRNKVNLGSSANLVNGPVNHALGDYVWCWNQHCLIRPGALARVVKALKENRHLDAIFVNFRCAIYPEQWPISAAGGYDGPFKYPFRSNFSDQTLDSWDEMLDPVFGMGTPSYLHLVKRSVWIHYWRDHEIGESYLDAISTYPHTTMLAETVLFKPSCFIGEPVITIYNGAQSWGDLRSRAKVWMRGWTDLTDHYRRNGMQGSRIADAEREGSRYVGEIIRDALITNRGDVLSMVPLYLRRYGLQNGAFRSIWNAYLESRCSPVCRKIGALQKSLERAYLYCFHRCRPARCWRARRTG